MTRSDIRRRRTARTNASRHLNGALALLPILGAATPTPSASHRPVAETRVLWKINTHLYAANIALADALNDGKVTIPPFGELTVAPAALAALREEPAAYRAGVLAPDLFPDMYVGGWFIHSDLSRTEHWTADDWLRHVWLRARAGIREGRRALRLATEQTEHMREIVAYLPAKIAGTAPQQLAPADGRRLVAQQGAAPNAANASWGQRCCATDIAELRASLSLLQSAGARLQNGTVLARLGRRASATQLVVRAAQVNAAVTAFANTRDAATAAAALSLLARQIEGLAATAAGTQ